jgi:glycerol-3-phosphate acyltransferase PlsY
MEIFYLAVITLLAYLIGAIPMGVLVADRHRIDVSQHGSGKTGTTNVLRTVGRRAAALVLVGDFLKGSIAVVAARLVAEHFLEGRATFGSYTISMVTLASVLAAAAAVLGHVRSIYLRLLQGRWRGGRGVATALGAVLVVNPWISLVALAVALPTIFISRYVSLGSILGAVAGGLTIILLVVLGQMDVLSLLFLFLSVFIIVAHRDNIERLLNGTERKLGERAKV